MLGNNFSESSSVREDLYARRQGTKIERVDTCRQRLNHLQPSHLYQKWLLHLGRPADQGLALCKNSIVCFLLVNLESREDLSGFVWQRVSNEDSRRGYYL